MVLESPLPSRVSDTTSSLASALRGRAESNPGPVGQPGDPILPQGTLAPCPATIAATWTSAMPRTSSAWSASHRAARRVVGEQVAAVPQQPVRVELKRARAYRLSVGGARTPSGPRSAATADGSSLDLPSAQGRDRHRAAVRPARRRPASRGRSYYGRAIGIPSARRPPTIDARSGWTEIAPLSAGATLPLAVCWSR